MLMPSGEVVPSLEMILDSIYFLKAALPVFPYGTNFDMREIMRGSVEVV